MFVQHNPHSFLTGDEPFLTGIIVEESSRMVVEELLFEPRHEGFIGIPHGGLGMGLCLDAWRRIGRPIYPITVKYKFGGSGVAIGDKVLFSVEKGNQPGAPLMVAKLTKPTDKTPYLRAEIMPGADLPERGPVDGPPCSEARELPYYRNCFVCGHHRTEPGLQRRFRAHMSGNDVVTSVNWGHESDDLDRAGYFLIGGEELHPAVLISIFDENTAWAGFMQTRSCGLSVRLEFTLMRPVFRREPLLFVARPAGIRGNPKAPRFFLGEGTIFSLTDPSSPEPVAFGRGEWVVMDQYTQQIKENLLPAHDWEWIFEAD